MRSEPACLGYKAYIFQTRIGILDRHLIGYQSLRKIDCLQILKSLFSLKNENLKNDYIILDLKKGFISERKLALVKIIDTITQLDKHDSFFEFPFYTKYL